MTSQGYTGSFGHDIAHATLSRRARRRRALLRHLAVWAAVTALALVAQVIAPYAS